MNQGKYKFKVNKARKEVMSPFFMAVTSQWPPRYIIVMPQA